MIKLKKTQNMVLLSLFTAIIFLLAFTPIGIIDLPIMKITILHIPVIVGSIILGPKKGAFLGLIFGACSLIKNTLVPGISSFVFTPFVPLPGTDYGSLLSLVVCFVPRILTGIIPWFVCNFVQKLISKKTTSFKNLAFSLAAIAGSFTNTFFVTGLIGTLFANAYSIAQGIPSEMLLKFIGGIIIINGIPEALASAVLVPLIYLLLSKIFKI